MATMTKEKEEYVKGVAAVIWGQLLLLLTIMS